MIHGITIALLGLADIIYLLSHISKYKRLIKLISKLTNTKNMNVLDVIKKFQNQPTNTKIPVIVKGIIKAKKSSSDKNILSAILSTPINKTDRLQQYAFEKIPYREVMKKAFWSRPVKLKDITFNLQDLTTNNNISVQDCKRSDISGMLTQMKSFETKIMGSANKILSCLKEFFNQAIFLSPLKFSNQIGEKISYYGIMNDTFGCVVGEARKKANGQIVIQNPKYITKQISFILNRLKSNQKVYRYSLILFFLFSLTILYYVLRWLYKNYGQKIKFFVQQQQIVDQNIPFHHLCIVCYSAARSIIFKPCRHYGVCFNCYRQIVQQICPICKEPIEGIIRVIKK